MILADESNYNLQLLHQQEGEDQFSFVMELLSKNAVCPKCSSLSTRKHSRYTRILKDVPLDDKEVHILLCSNKWFCDQSDCSARIFTERLPWLDSYRRKTKRLEEKLTQLAFSMSCLQAEKICQNLCMSVSHDALLSLIYRKEVVKSPSPFRRVG